MHLFSKQAFSNFFCEDTAEELVDMFFEVEVEMEKDVCRDLVCSSPKDEEGFSNSFFLFFFLRVVLQ